MKVWIVFGENWDECAVVESVWLSEDGAKARMSAILATNDRYLDLRDWHIVPYLTDCANPISAPEPVVDRRSPQQVILDNAMRDIMLPSILEELKADNTLLERFKR